jgi:ABC-type phosphate transport system substrate-binding protein
MRNGVIIGFVFFAALLAPVHAIADEVVFVSNRDVPVASLGKEDIKKIFLGKKLNWEDGGKVVFVVQDRTDASDTFLKTFVRKNAYDYDLFWKKQVFTGKGQAPQAFSSDEGLIRFVAKTPGAIGYVSSGADVSDVKIIPVR